MERPSAFVRYALSLHFYQRVAPCFFHDVTYASTSSCPSVFFRLAIVGKNVANKIWGFNEFENGSLIVKKARETIGHGGVPGYQGVMATTVE